LHTFTQGKAMIEIEIDYNNDRININDNGLRADRCIVYSLDVERPKELEKFFVELFNRIDGLINIRLVIIDEDNRKTIDEW
jgi:hypothetical protein